MAFAPKPTHLFTISSKPISVQPPSSSKTSATIIILHHKRKAPLHHLQWVLTTKSSRVNDKNLKAPPLTLMSKRHYAEKEQMKDEQNWSVRKCLGFLYLLGSLQPANPFIFIFRENTNKNVLTLWFNYISLNSSSCHSSTKYVMLISLRMMIYTTSINVWT